MSTTLNEFLNKDCLIDDGSKISKAGIFIEYLEHVKKFKYVPLSKKAFHLTLSDMGFMVEKIQGIEHYSGIGLPKNENISKDHVEMFLKDVCCLNEYETISISFMYDQFKKYMHNKGKKYLGRHQTIIGKFAFNREMQKKGYVMCKSYELRWQGIFIEKPI